MKPGLRLGTLKRMARSRVRKHKKRSHIYAELKAIRTSMLIADNARNRQMEMTV